MECTSIIGLEVHVELNTESKMFCSCKADHFGEKPNANTCPVCLALPGSLPVPNKEAIEGTIMLGLALNCEIPFQAKFDRKNYFYPDLPKGYQISQYDKPFCVNGEITLDNEVKIKVKRVHLEEDTGKLTHENGVTKIDFNRAGVPLVEIVTEPDFRSTQEVKEYLQELQQIIRSLGISEADMEKGQMRLEPTVNLELRTKNGVVYTPLVELKNINSFKFAIKAIEYEIERQREEFERTGITKQMGKKSTRGWSEKENATVLQREKEEAGDYRYFPEPDIPPFQWTELEIINWRLEIEKIELPGKKVVRYINDYSLSQTVAEIIAQSKDKAIYFEEAVEFGSKNGIGPAEVANVIVNKRLDVEKLSPEQLIKAMTEKKSGPSMGEEEILKIVEQVISANPQPVAEYKLGKVNIIEFLVGQVAKITKGQADITKIRELLKEKISS